MNSFDILHSNMSGQNRSLAAGNLGIEPIFQSNMHVTCNNMID